MADWFQGVRTVRVPAGLIGTLVLICAVETAISTSRDPLTPLEGYTWKLATDAAGEVARGHETLGMGDSLMIHGFQPAEFEAAGGGSAVNLAMAAAQPATTYFLLRRTLASGARPRTVVVDFAPYLLNKPPRLNRKNWAILPGWSDSAELAYEVGEAGFAVDLFIRELLPSYQCRDELRRQVLGRLEGREVTTELDNLAAARHWSIHRGGLVLAAIPDFDGRVAEVEADVMLRRGKGYQEVHLRYLERFLELAGREGIRVVWVLTPFTPAFRERWEQNGEAARERELVAGLLARHGNLEVVDARESGYGPELFRDSVHLAAPGALCLSRDLGRYVSRGAQAGQEAARWTRLPAYRPATGGEVLEDFERSRLAIRERQGLKR